MQLRPMPGWWAAAGMDITPLAVHGVMTINDQGMLLDGVAHTEIFPETFMDGTMATQVFIPSRASCVTPM
ncbi:MAG: hypothetical protein R2851_14305 [Caldilineaceae bacterium]